MRIPKSWLCYLMLLNVLGFCQNGLKRKSKDSPYFGWFPMSKIINPLHFAFFVAARLVLLVGPWPYLSDFVSHGGGGGAKVWDPGLVMFLPRITTFEVNTKNVCCISRARGGEREREKERERERERKRDVCVCGCVCVLNCVIIYIYTVIQYIDRCLYQKIYNICTVIIFYICVCVCVCTCRIVYLLIG